jgi:hypothetical protein
MSFQRAATIIQEAGTRNCDVESGSIRASENNFGLTILNATIDLMTKALRINLRNLGITAFCGTSKEKAGKGETSQLYPLFVSKSGYRPPTKPRGSPTTGHLVFHYQSIYDIFRCLPI